MSDVLSAGAQIGDQYQVLDRLGRGGMGDIFLATDTVLDRKVAIKFLRPRETAIFETEERFRREARLLSRLNHPNVVVIHSFGHLDNDIKYMVMEYVAGKDLGDVLEDLGQLEARSFCHIMAQVFSAVAEAHRAGIVHRDLKPANVLIAQVGGDPMFVKVLDFGLAKVFEGVEPLAAEDAARPEGHISRAGVCVGTPIYMSPEQARGFDVDGRSDVYSLGVMACQLLTGRLPLERATTRRQILAHLLDEPILPGALRPDMELSPEIDDVVARSLAKEPEDRYANVAEFARDLLGAVRRWGGLTDANILEYQRFAAGPARPGDPSSSDQGASTSADTDEDLTLPDGAAPMFSERYFATHRESRYVGDMVCLCVATFVTPATEPMAQEEYLDCLGVVANRLHQCITTHAGRTLGALADSPLVVWGHDAAADDSAGSAGYAERAMNAALAIRTSLNALRNDPSLTPEFVSAFGFRIALDAGTLAIADFGALGPAVHGPAAGRARLIASRAPTGEIWVSGAVQRRVSELFVCDVAGDLGDLGDAGTATVYEVRGKSKLAGYMHADQLMGVRSTMVGRDLEREELHSALVEIVAMHEPRVVMLAGQQGMGKGRLVSEFIRDVEDLPEPHSFHIGRCAQPSEGSPFQPFIEAIRHHADIRIDDPEPVARAKLLEFIREHAADEAFTLTSDERKMRALLEELLGISETAPHWLTAVHGDQARRSMLFDSVAQLYHRLAQRTPIIFVIHDFELATAATKALVSHLVGRVGEAPVLLLLVTENRPRQAVDVSFFRTPHAVTLLHLEGLDDDTMNARITNTLRDMVDRPSGLVDEIARVAAGRPWFVDECIRCLVDRGTIQIDFGEWTLSNPDQRRFSLPDSFEEMFADRLEHLPRGLRRGLDVAAVAGRFWPTMLTELSGERLSDNAVFELQRRGFIEERGEYVVAGEHDYSMVRRSMRQALYRWLDPARRARLHGDIGDWLDRRSASASMIHDARIGAHYRLASRWFEALPFTLRAARMARRSQAVEFAVELLERCLRLLDRCPTTDELTARDKAEIRLEVGGDLLALLVKTHRHEAAVSVAATILGDKARLKDPASALKSATIALWMGRALQELGHAERADSALQASDAMLPQSGQDALELRLELAIERALLQGSSGDISGAHQTLRSAMGPQTVSAAGGTVVLATAFIELANAEAHLGECDNAMRHYDKGQALALAANAPATVVDALSDKAHLHDQLGERQHAVTAWGEALALSERWDLLRRQARVLTEMGRADLERGEIHQALSRLRSARGIFRHLSSDEGLATSSRLVAEAELELGRGSNAERSAAQAIAASEALGDDMLLGMAHRTRFAVAMESARQDPNHEGHRIAVRRHYAKGVAAFERAGALREVEALKRMRNQLG